MDRRRPGESNELPSGSSETGRKPAAKSGSKKQGQKRGRRFIFSLRRFGAVESPRHVPPPPTLSNLTRAELEALLVGLFTEVASLKQVVAHTYEAGLRGRYKRNWTRQLFN